VFEFGHLAGLKRNRCVYVAIMAQILDFIIICQNNTLLAAVLRGYFSELMVLYLSIVKSHGIGPFGPFLVSEPAFVIGPAFAVSPVLLAADDISEAVIRVFCPGPESTATAAAHPAGLFIIGPCSMNHWLLTLGTGQPPSGRFVSQMIAS